MGSGRSSYSSSPADAMVIVEKPSEFDLPAGSSLLPCGSDRPMTCASEHLDR